jgi:hypothetical protein
MKICKSKHHKSWFVEECLKFDALRKQAKLQWLEDPSEVNEGNVGNVRRKATRHFRNKKRDYLKDKIYDF